MPILPKATVTHAETYEVYAFCYFPETIAQSSSWAHGSAAAPGRARPFVGGGAGGEDTVSFTAQIEGERSRHERRVAGQSVPVDISPDLHLIRSWLLPDDPNGTGAYGFPAALFLKLGTIVDAKVKLRSMETNVTRFGTADGEAIVIAANVSLVFEIIDPHETAPQYRGRKPASSITWRTV